jgi:hypothetical protein
MRITAKADLCRIHVESHVFELTNPKLRSGASSLAMVFHDLCGAHFASHSEFEEHLEENAFRVSVGHRRWRRHRSRRSDLLPRDFAAGSELQ